MHGHQWLENQGPRVQYHGIQVGIGQMKTLQDEWAEKKVFQRTLLQASESQHPNCSWTVVRKVLAFADFGCKLRLPWLVHSFFFFFWQRIRSLAQRPLLVFLDKLCIAQHDASPDLVPLFFFFSSFPCFFWVPGKNIVFFAGVLVPAKDAELKQRGILGLAAFLGRSDHLTILWSRRRVGQQVPVRPGQGAQVGRFGGSGA